MSIITPEKAKFLIDNLRPCKKIVSNELKGKEFNNVLEVGCQYGESLQAIRNEFPDKELTGIDVDLSVIERGKNFLKNIKMIWGNGNELPFENNAFDVVFTNALFCIIRPSDVESILNEIIRVAKKYIYLAELDVPKMIEVVDKDRVACNWEAIFKARGFKAHKRKITEEEWDVLPWRHYGYLIFVDKSEKLNPIL